MKILLLFYLQLLIFVGYSQETKFIQKKRSGYFEEYYVLKNDEKVKHGTYVKYKSVFSGVQILEHGNYANGKKEGAWEYFFHTPFNRSENSIREKGSYVNGKKNGVWTSYYLDTIPDITNHENFGKKKRIDSIRVNIEQKALKLKHAGMYLNDKRVGEWISLDYRGEVFQRYNFSKRQLIFDRSIQDTLVYNTNRPALFVGGMPCLIEFFVFGFQHAVVVPTIDIDSTILTVAFKIDKNGKVGDLAVAGGNANEAFEMEAKRIVNLTDSHWIAALSDAENIDSIYKIEFLIKRSVRSGVREFRTFFRPIVE